MMISKKRTVLVRSIVLVCLFSLILIYSISWGDKDGSLPLYNQWEITERTPLLNPDGTLAAWGWARNALMEYVPSRIQEKNKKRLKEWDFYAITSPDYYLEVTLADISWAILAAVSFIDYQTKKVSSNLYFDVNSQLLSLPTHSYENATFEKDTLFLSFTTGDKKRILNFNFPKSIVGPRIKGTIELRDDPEEDFLATAAPFQKPDFFFYTNKIVALPASGDVEVANKTYSFAPDKSFAVLDWGRGVWPEEFEWGWAVAAGTVDGKRLGFNIGFGDEDNSRFSGNAVVFDGVLHKMGNINWSYTKDDIMKPWHFKGDDGRFNIVLEPFYDQSAKIELGIYAANITKVHGMLSGCIILDDGTELRINGILGFAEHCFQKW